MNRRAVATCEVSAVITVTTLPGNFIFQSVRSLPQGSHKQRFGILKQEPPSSLNDSISNINA